MQSRGDMRAKTRKFVRSYAQSTLQLHVVAKEEGSSIAQLQIHDCMSDVNLLQRSRKLKGTWQHLYDIIIVYFAALARPGFNFSESRL